MRNIAIVGFSGTPLALALKNIGYNVTLYSDRTAKQIRTDKLTSIPLAFGSTLELEKKWKLNFWQPQFPSHESVSFTFHKPSEEKRISWHGISNKPFQFIDPRLKFSRWMNEFECTDGELVIDSKLNTSLNYITKWHDLTIIADPDNFSHHFAENDSFATIQQNIVLGCMHVKNMTPVKEFSGLRTNIISGIGSYYTMPGMLNNEHCDMMLFIGDAASKFAFWQHPHYMHPTAQLETAVSLLEKHVPWEAERCAHLTLADKNTFFTERYSHSIKQPVFKLPCGKFALGMTNTLIKNNPLIDSNNMAKCTEIYFNSIIAHGNNRFDQSWMQNTFEQYWQQHGNAVTKWSQLPLSNHVIEVLQRASKNSLLATTFANAFDDPNILFPWISDRASAEKEIKRMEDELAFLDDTMDSENRISRAFRR